jgi:hypothetical protein
MAGLPQIQKNDDNQGDGQFGREVAAATYAATGNLETAALKMAWPYATPVPAWLKAQVNDIKADTQIDDYIWVNNEDALIAGSGNPQVRAGVLRLVSLLPGISLTRGKADGQPALTLTQTTDPAQLKRAATGKAKLKIDTGPASQEAITINADTGIPLQIADTQAGKITGTISYVVTRVNLADIAARKF